MQRLGFPPNASLEHKKLSVDLAEVIIKWELQRIKDDESESKLLTAIDDDMEEKSTTVKRATSEDFAESQRKKLNADNVRSSSMFCKLKLYTKLLRMYFIFILRKTPARRR